MFKKIFIASTVLMPFAAQGQNANWQSQVWEGKIANLEIVLEAKRLVDDNGKVRIGAHYFYKKHRKIINLSPVGTGMQFLETNYDCVYGIDENCKKTGEVTFDKKDDFSSGIWSDGGKKSFKIQLKKVSQTNYKSNQKIDDFENFFYAYNLNLDSVFYQKQVSGEFIDSKPSLFANSSIVYKTDKVTKVKFPRILAFESPAIKAKVNSILEANHKQLIGDALECASMPENFPGQGTLGGFDEYQAEVKAINSRFMTIEESGSLFCGGAHPNNFWFHSIYNMTDGTKFDFSKYFMLYDSPKDKDEGNYNSKFNAFTATLTPDSKYAVAGVDSEMFNDCASSGYGTTFSLGLNEKGVSFNISDVPHVMGACMGEYFVVPYKDMKHLMTGEGLKFFAAYLK